ncbi:MAG: hypothetical protein H6545_05640 [Bacteroidales bacterium]|jgi:hypothetical protein|nr:hypothetical protein [Bacteroidales bacterium]NLD62311.1 hypothetical protein [Bacteroidales bacterium]HOO67046.1 hypothetical protein [Bacteroidales bacterium]HPQ64778.1 hypothetical protein [Bacteroidales bacterium]HRW27066.1 hypothetical protein [Bacteroidales bacterium]
MKNLACVLIILLGVLSVSCEQTEEISGDSSLKIINDCDYGVRIYFDDINLGRVESEDEKTWSVPSGTHTVKATCSFANDYEEDFNFIAGVTTTIRLELQKKSKKILANSTASEQ